MMTAAPILTPAPASRPDRTWVQGFAPILREHGFEPLRVEGTLPADLDGAFYWNCPARRPIDVPDWYSHIADGEGAIIGVRLGGGSAAGALKFVRTKSFEKERVAGKRLYSRYM